MFACVFVYLFLCAYLLYLCIRIDISVFVYPCLCLCLMYGQTQYKGALERPPLVLSGLGNNPASVQLREFRPSDSAATNDKTVQKFVEKGRKADIWKCTV